MAQKKTATEKDPKTAESERLKPQASSLKPSSKPSYTVLARRYRSRDFDELVGQDPIARTLRNAVRSDRAAHAYLFCGTRGVGKTSMARILAKALNVTGDLAEADQIAEAILRGNDLDVIEIDGASNRGVNEARDLIAAAGLSPARCRFKIYIIDEVHMLTREAFNALLKTMEEPPAHVKFILCTTEPHKVPATIQSRCQRFDFRQLSASQIAGQLRRILEQEGVQADDEVIAQIARLGRGSMRDALSLLDRLLSAGEPALTTLLLEQMLGLPDQTLIENLVDAIADGNTAAALDAGAKLLDGGVGIEQALEMITEHFRDLMIIAACGAENDLLELSSHARAVASRQAGRFDTAGLVHMIALCDAVARNARSSAAARALFDAALVRLCLSEHLADIAGLLGEDGAPAPPKKKEPVIAAPVSPPARADPPPQPPRPAVVETKPDPPEPAPTTGGAEVWAKVQAIVRDSPPEHAMVEPLAFESFDGCTMRLRVENAALGRWVVTQTDALADLVRRVTGHGARVEIACPAPDAGSPESTRRRFEEAQEVPVIRTAMEIFNADIVEVEESPPPADPPGS